MEPIEASLFSSSPELSNAQDERYRMEGAENAADVALGAKAVRTHSRAASTANSTAVDGGEAFINEKWNIVTFEGEEDPRNFSSAKKWFVTIAASSLCFAVALGSSIVTGDLQQPVIDLHSSQEVVNLSVSLFVCGFGVGPLLFAPLSEVVGRKPIYIVSMFGYFIFTLPSALAQNGATLVIGRLLSGIAASAPMCNVGGSISDVWLIKDRGIPMSIFSGTVFLGPTLGPILGGWIGQKAGWRYIYWLLFAITGFTFLATLFIPETLAPILLKRKAQGLRDTGNSLAKSQEELDHLSLTLRLKIALTRPFYLMINEPIVLFMSVYLTFVYSLLYLFFFAFPISFAEVRNFSYGATGSTFVSIMIGLILAMICMPLQEKKYRDRTQNGHYPVSTSLARFLSRIGLRPEARLYPMMIGSIVLPISLFLYAYTGGNAAISYVVPCVAGGIFGFSVILIYVSANSYIVDSYSDVAASAIAAKTLLRSEVAATVPLFVNQMFAGMGFSNAGLLLALISVVIAPTPFFFYYRGEKIRLGSTRASKACRGSGNVAKDIAH